MILSLDEKMGGIRKLEGDIEDFKETIDTLGLVDMENNNGEYTWSNWHSCSQHVTCRLDHFLVSKPLMMDGFLMEANILYVARFDH